MERVSSYHPGSRIPCREREKMIKSGKGTFENEILLFFLIVYENVE